MPDFDELFSRLDGDDDVDALRTDIANAIVDVLEATEESFGYWEKAHIAHAIAALAWNINIGNRDTRSWLRLCLVNLELAQTPKDKRSDDYAPRNKQVDALTFDELLADARKLGGHT